MFSAPESVKLRFVKSWRDRRLLLIAALLHGLVYVLLLPAWMGEDEPWHVEYAHHISTGHAPWGGVEMHSAERPEDDDRRLMDLSQLQVRRRMRGLDPAEIRETQLRTLASMEEEFFFRRIDFMPWPGGIENFNQVQDAFTATHQPPLYHALGALLVRASGAETPLEELRTLRWLALACYLAMIAATLALARHLTEDLRLVGLAGFICAWLPMHARQAAVANNDVLANVIGAALLLAAAHQLSRTTERITTRAVLALIVMIALAFLTKTTTLACALLAGLAFLVTLSRGDRKRALSMVCACAAVAAAGFAYLRATHSPSLPTSWQDLCERFAEGFNADSVSELWRTTLGAFNWYSRDLPSGVSQVAMVLVVILFLAACTKAFPGTPQRNRAVLILCLCALLAQCALIGLRGISVGRYLFPVLPAAATLMAIGAAAIVPERSRGRIISALVIAFITFDAVFLWRGLLVEQYLVLGS